MKPRVIWDDGTPNCLPRWACDEIVRYRLENQDLRDEISKLRVKLAVANGVSKGDALLEEFQRHIAETEQYLAGRKPR